MSNDTKASRIYVASSWRNERQPDVVRALRAAGHEVYDFRNPAEGDSGFHWFEIDPEWQSWSPSEFRQALDHPVAIDGYGKDFDAMRWADVYVLVMPCGRSAHLEAGHAMGAGKPVVILLSDGEPELMYRLALERGEIVETIGAVVNAVREVKINKPSRVHVHNETSAEWCAGYDSLEADIAKAIGREADDVTVPIVERVARMQRRIRRSHQDTAEEIADCIFDNDLNHDEVCKYVAEFLESEAGSNPSRK